MRDDDPHKIGSTHSEIDRDPRAGARTDDDGRRDPQVLEKRCGVGRMRRH
jgi:hypothetical protein